MFLQTIQPLFDPLQGLDQIITLIGGIFHRNRNGHHRITQSRTDGIQLVAHIASRWFPLLTQGLDRIIRAGG